MREILPGIYHWRVEHPDIHIDVDSYFMSALKPAVLIDPLEPAEGVDWFADLPRPEHIFLTNRLHDRHCQRFVEPFGCRIWCHRAGLHEFADGGLEGVEPFDHGDELAAGIRALEVGVLCPEETALHIPVSAGVLCIGDAVVRCDELCFVGDDLLGDDPAAIKRGIRDAFQRLCDTEEFDHLLFAHGEPVVGDGKRVLQTFLDGLRDL